MSLAIAVLLSGSCAYALLMLAFARGLRREVRATGRKEATDDASRPFVSVLIPARNEAASIASCLRSLRATTYPDDRYEIIVIDDGSTDSTVERVRRFQQRHRPVAAGEQTLPAETLRLRLVQREDSPGSKHGALLDGLQAARGELILTTDADCAVPPGWMSAMVNRFDEATGFVAGPVRYASDGSWPRRWQQLEFAGLMAVGAGSIGLGRPTICSSANVAYRRAVAEAYLLDLPDAARPAADEELAQRLAATSPWQVRFCASPAAAVETAPPDSATAFWSQRQRWALTGARFQGFGLTVLVGALYAVFLLLFAGLLSVWVGGAWSLSVLAAFILKTSSEAVLLRPACRAFDVPYHAGTHALGQVLHVPYIVLVSAASLLVPPRWKGRPVFSDS